MINFGEYLFESSEQIFVFDTGNFMCYALQGNAFQDVATKEELNFSFKYGFKSVIEYRKFMGQTPISPMT